MGRIRTIKPEFPQSETIGRLSRDARLLFIQLWTIADDDGRARAASRMLASLLYPYDDDAPKLIEGWLGELEGAGCIRRYSIDGSSYLDIPHWFVHQKIDKATKSRLPEYSRDFDEHSRNVEYGPRTVDLGVDQDQSSLRSDSSAEVAELFPGDKKISKPKAEIAERKADLKAFGEAFNEIAAANGLPTIDMIAPGSTRERHALATLKWLRESYEGGPEELFARIRASPYLLGQINNFKITFDWMCGAENRQKIWDGNYADRKQKAGIGQFGGAQYAYR